MPSFLFKTEHHFSPETCAGVYFQFSQGTNTLVCKRGLVLLSLNLFGVELDGKFSPQKVPFEGRWKSVLRVLWCPSYAGPHVHLQEDTWCWEEAMGLQASSSCRYQTWDFKPLTVCICLFFCRFTPTKAIILTMQHWSSICTTPLSTSLRHVSKFRTNSR